jgi:hypothetical protein
VAFLSSDECISLWKFVFAYCCASTASISSRCLVYSDFFSAKFQIGLFCFLVFEYDGHHFYQPMNAFGSGNLSSPAVMLQ